MAQHLGRSLFGYKISATRAFLEDVQSQRERLRQERAEELDRLQGVLASAQSALRERERAVSSAQTRQQVLLSQVEDMARRGRRLLDQTREELAAEEVQLVSEWTRREAQLGGRRAALHSILRGIQRLLERLDNIRNGTSEWAGLFLDHETDDMIVPAMEVPPLQSPTLVSSTAPSADLSDRPREDLAKRAGGLWDPDPKMLKKDHDLQSLREAVENRKENGTAVASPWEKPNEVVAAVFGATYPPPAIVDSWMGARPMRILIDAADVLVRLQSGSVIGRLAALEVAGFSPRVLRYEVKQNTGGRGTILAEDVVTVNPHAVIVRDGYHIHPVSTVSGGSENAPPSDGTPAKGGGHTRISFHHGPLTPESGSSKTQTSHLEVDGIPALSAAIQEYGYHLKSHTQILQDLAQTTTELRQAAHAQNQILDRLSDSVETHESPSQAASTSASEALLPPDAKQGETKVEQWPSRRARQAGHPYPSWDPKRYGRFGPRPRRR